MPDIDPAALSRPSASLSTPVLKSITVSAPATQKVTKTSQIIPARIDLEPLYKDLRAAIGNEHWNTYKDSLSHFIQGRLNQVEYSERIDPILYSPNFDHTHLHNKLLAAIYGNLTREMPDQGLAPWVSANNKPSTNVGAKPVTGDAAERKLKADVMQLLNRDRRRIKDLAQNDYDPYEAMAGVFMDHHRHRTTRVPDMPQSASGLSKMNWDLEIRKRFGQPLAVESGEFPDTASIEARMLPIAYECGLINGHASDVAQFMTSATETFIKEFLSTVFSRTRSNGPGDSGSTGFGSGTSWIQTHKYRRQLRREEAACARGELSRDKSGLLPIEAKAASERAPLGMADLRLALEIGDSGVTSFPIVRQEVVNGYRDGELEKQHEYTWLHDDKPLLLKEEGQDRGVDATGVNPSQALTNGHANHFDPMDIDEEPSTWDGTDLSDMQALDSVLDSCLMVP
ncbi:transcriptional regulator of RNA polII, SAGA, subunit-domain-containing protein [Xylariomycetidae sp. FL2044]|nr:transcriptional regulator of RNA polII, SAGA, subunit-domain-containing protein [Xylariomycetidae sp. FL2044]